VVGRGDGLRVECRIPGADANPYLAYAALLAAGLAGLEERREPGPAFRGDVYAAEGLAQIPRSLAEALAGFEASRVARKAFGDAVVEHYLHFARSEAAALESRVSDLERSRYFERV
jgi:glutamine synthetase